MHCAIVMGLYTELLIQEIVVCKCYMSFRCTCTWCTMLFTFVNVWEGRLVFWVILGKFKALHTGGMTQTTRECEIIACEYFASKLFTPAVINKVVRSLFLWNKNGTRGKTQPWTVQHIFENVGETVCGPSWGASAACEVWQSEVNC